MVVRSELVETGWTETGEMGEKKTAEGVEGHFVFIVFDGCLEDQGRVGK